MPRLEWLLRRQNSLNGRVYGDDPTVLAFELCNEPRAAAAPAKRASTRAAYMQWVRGAAALVKRLAPRTLLVVGSEGQS